MKRTILFLLTNLAVILVLYTTLSILGLDKYLDTQGLNITGVLIASAVIGFGGAIISLLMSKQMAKWSTGARVIAPNASNSQKEAWLLDTVRQLSNRAGINCPEVAIYEGAPNAFATGAFKNDSLVAVSTGLLQSLKEEEIAAVMAHEIAHVANGDMVTLTLIQGVVNTFVIFLARVIGYFVDRVLLKNERGNGVGYFVTIIVCEILFGIIASTIVAWYSRQREYQADAGAAALVGAREPMIRALIRLGSAEPSDLPNTFEASGITGKISLAALFATHPPITQRISALKNLRMP